MDDPFDPWFTPEKPSTLGRIYHNWIPPMAVATLVAWAIASRFLQLFPPVGTYIAIVAVGGVVVTIWPPEKAWGKAVWLGVFIFLGVFEINNLYRDRDTHDAKEAENNEKERTAREAETQAFKKIGDGIDASIATAQTGFGETARHMGALADLSSENIKTVTGGDSFAYMSLTEKRNPVLVHVGRYPLYGVEVRIVDVAKVMAAGAKYDPFSDLTLHPGDMPVGKAWMDRAISIPFSDPSKQDFNIFFGAKNGSWTENLMIRLINGKQEVARQVVLDVPPDKAHERMAKTQLCETISANFPRKEVYWKHASTRSCQ